MITYILKDMLEPMGYMPVGLLAGIVFLIILKIYEIFFGGFRKRTLLSREVLYFCTIIYVSAVLKLAFFSREPGSCKGLDLVLFSSWNEGVRGQAFFIENILMFIPFGILFPFIFKRFRKGWICVMCGFMCSVLLEGMQFVTERGFCQLDDVVANIVGTLIGWGIFKLMDRTDRWIRRRKKPREI